MQVRVGSVQQQEEEVRAEQKLVGKSLLIRQIETIYDLHLNSAPDIQTPFLRIYYVIQQEMLIFHD